MTINTHSNYENYCLNSRMNIELFDCSIKFKTYPTRSTLALAYFQELFATPLDMCKGLAIVEAAKAISRKNDPQKGKKILFGGINIFFLDPLHILSRVVSAVVRLATIIFGFASPSLAVRSWKAIEYVEWLNCKAKAALWKKIAPEKVPYSTSESIAPNRAVRLLSSSQSAELYRKVHAIEIEKAMPEAAIHMASIVDYLRKKNEAKLKNALKPLPHVKIMPARTDPAYLKCLNNPILRKLKDCDLNTLPDHIREQLKASKAIELPKNIEYDYDNKLLSFDMAQRFFVYLHKEFQNEMTNEADHEYYLTSIKLCQNFNSILRYGNMKVCSL